MISGRPAGDGGASQQRCSRGNPVDSAARYASGGFPSRGKIHRPIPALSCHRARSFRPTTSSPPGARSKPLRIGSHAGLGSPGPTRSSPGTSPSYLAWRKRSGLAAASIKLEAVALRIFFRFLLARKNSREQPRRKPFRPARREIPAGNAQSLRDRAPAGKREREPIPSAFATAPCWSSSMQAVFGSRSCATSGSKAWISRKA